MSYSQLRKSTVKQDVLNALRRCGLPGSALTIEVTESMELLNYPDLNQIFRQWKTHGIFISVDDFGTGYSSLSRLKEMDIDEIKIDRCFVNNIQKSVYNQRLLNNIVELADGCQIHVCCEGVETAEELALLEKLQPSLYQGFLFARPCSEKEFSAQYLCPKEELPWASLRQKVSLPSSASETLPSPDASEEIAQTILNAETDIFYLSDLDTYELYYLNPAGQKTFDVQDYKGKKCYQVLQGADKPCSFCTNAFLRRDSFHLWENKNEYCGRHFLLKDKLVEYQGKNVRLEVALDITKQELVSEQARERLAFADRIVGYMNTLSRQSDYDRAVDQVLASVGDFYQSDRAYLFGRLWFIPGTGTIPLNGVHPMFPIKKNLQNVSPDALSRWLAIFEKEQSIILHNLAPLRESSPVEWEILSQQGIHRLIAVPVRDEGKTIGFIGVDNPRYAIHDDSQVRVLAGFLLTRIRQDRNERRYQALLRSSDQDVLAALQVGFWLMRLDRRETVPRQILFNEVAARLLGFTRDCSPAENCRVWYSRIVEADRPKLEEKLHQTVQNGALLQTAIHWRHPQKGIVLLRFSGIRLQSTDDWIELKGYCRILDET